MSGIGNKVYRVTYTDMDKVTHVHVTRAWTCDHARTNTFEAHGMDIRIRAVVVI